MKTTSAYLVQDTNGSEWIVLVSKDETSIRTADGADETVFGVSDEDEAVESVESDTVYDPEWRDAHTIGYGEVRYA